MARCGERGVRVGLGRSIVHFPSCGEKHATMLNSNYLQRLVTSVSGGPGKRNESLFVNAERKGEKTTVDTPRTEFEKSPVIPEDDGTYATGNVTNSSGGSRGAVSKVKRRSRWQSPQKGGIRCFMSGSRGVGSVESRKANRTNSHGLGHRLELVVGSLRDTR